MTGKKLFELYDVIKNWGLNQWEIEDLSELSDEQVKLILAVSDNDNAAARLLKYFTDSFVPDEVKLQAAKYFKFKGSNHVGIFNVSDVANIRTLYENFGAEKYLELVKLASESHQVINSKDLIDISFGGPKKIRYDLVKAIITATDSFHAKCIATIAKNQLTYEKGITLEAIEIVGNTESLMQAQYVTSIAIDTTILNRLDHNTVIDFLRLASTLEEGKKIEISHEIYTKLIQGNGKNGRDIKSGIDRLFDVYENVRFWKLYSYNPTEALYLLKKMPNASEQEISKDFLVRRKIKNT